MKRIVLIGWLVLLLSPVLLPAATLFDTRFVGRSRISLAFDPFYMPLDIFIPLTRSDIPKLSTQKELAVYWHLLSRFFLPRFIVLEASVYPLPLAGSAFKRQWPAAYDKLTLFEGFNVVESVTTSTFQEPWAFSVFLGNVVDFSPPVKTTIIRTGINAGQVVRTVDFDSWVGKAYGGLLVSYGNYHLRANDFLRDDWLELEFKTIGRRWKAGALSSWSYRIGGRYHSHPEIRSYLMVGFKREHLDRAITRFTVLDNSFFDLEYRAEAFSFQPLSLRLLIGKKFPIRGRKPLPSLTLGVIWNFNSPYTGSLEDTAEPEFRFLVTPAVSF